MLRGGGRLFAQSADESAVKAAFVFNLTKYVEWPQTNSKELLIAVLADSNMTETLKRMLDGKTSQSRLIKVVAYVDGVPDHFDLLYVGNSPHKKLPPLLLRARTNEALTVGDTVSFAHEGGMVGLLKAGDHIEMEINLEEVQSAHLKISSHLLALTGLVHRVSAPPG